MLDPTMACPPLAQGWFAQSGTLHCGGGLQRLGGILEVFFESYWARFTSLREVEWRCHVQGRARFILLRRDALSGLEKQIAEFSGDGAAGTTSILLQTNLATVGESSLQVEIEADAGAVISNIGWYARAPAPNLSRLGIVVTTYEREAFIRANLGRLSGQLDGSELVIVNHGLTGLSERMLDAVPAGEHVRFVDQENSGGAGGFTRGMREHREKGCASHILLMDDDIDICGDLIKRVNAVLGYADRPFCIGGAMFDYYKRTKLFSAGDFLLPGSFGIGHIAPSEECDVSTPSGVDFLAKIHRPDFNGWWCFAFPVNAIDFVGLPMPCFIRGDDVEYGYRLKNSGWPTIGWPGVAVWHMPFAEKSAPWHMFYDRRNSLFANAIHRRLDRIAAFRKMFGGFVHHLLRYDYDRVRAMTLGISAFNRGSAAMASWTHDDHRRLLIATSRHAVHATENIEAAMILAPTRLYGSRRSLAMVARLLTDMFLPRRRGPASRLPPGIIWRPDYLKRPTWVVEAGIENASVQVFRYSRQETWAAVWRSAGALVGMLWHFRQKVDIPRS
ncbi:glycosyltransferase [Sphingobium chungangianum]